jgi:hypothetical protein
MTNLNKYYEVKIFPQLMELFKLLLALHKKMKDEMPLKNKHNLMKSNGFFTPYVILCEIKLHDFSYYAKRIFFNLFYMFEHNIFLMRKKVLINNIDLMINNNNNFYLTYTHCQNNQTLW